MRQLVGLFPRVMRGLKRHKEPAAADPWTERLGRRHASVLYLLVDDPKTVGELASELELELATVSGVVAELDRAGLVERRQDPADRRRTIAAIRDEQRAGIEGWLSGASAPLARVLEQLSGEERAVFVRAMGLLDQGTRSVPVNPVVAGLVVQRGEMSIRTTIPVTPPRPTARPLAELLRRNAPFIRGARRRPPSRL